MKGMTFNVRKGGQYIVNPKDEKETPRDARREERGSRPSKEGPKEEKPQA